MNHYSYWLKKPVISNALCTEFWLCCLCLMYKVINYSNYVKCSFEYSVVMN